MPRLNTYAHSFNTPCRMILRGLLLLLTLSLLAISLAAQTDQGLLEPGKPIERELGGGQTHSYSIALTAGQYMHVVVDQRGIDVVVSLFAPDGKKLTEVDSPNGSLGPEPISVITEAAGSYRLEVRSFEAKAEAGRYQVKVEELRTARPQDKSRIASQQALAEGTQLESEGSAGSLRKAIAKYEEALPLLRAANDRAKEAETLLTIGTVFSSLGYSQKALDYYNQALPLGRAIGDRALEGYALDNIGRVYNTWGEKQKALDYHNQALTLVRAVGARWDEAVVLGNIGRIYYSLGEKQKALDYYNQGLPLFRAVGNRKFEAYMLLSIGEVYESLAQWQKTLNYYNQALPLVRAVGDRAGEASTLTLIGQVYESLAQWQKALDYYNQALPLHRAVGDRRYEASTLTLIGIVYRDLGENQKALEFYNLALPLWRAVGDRSGEAGTLYVLARFERDRNNLPEARRNIEATLAIIEALRAGYTNQQLRSAYFATVQDYYEFYIDLLMRLHKQRPNGGHDGEALQISERARARALLETLAEANADIRQGVDPKLVERERALQQRLNARAQAQMKLLSNPHTEEQAKGVAQEIEALTSELQQVATEIRQTSPRYAALTQPQPLSLKEIQTQVLDKDTLLLAYSLGTDRSYLWAVTPNSITSYELPRRDDIEAVARQVYALLADKTSADDALAALRSGSKQPTTSTPAGSTPSPNQQAQSRPSPDAASRLSQLVLAPVAAQLGNKRLLIVADGALQYIPFGALPSPVGSGQSGSSPTTSNERSKTEKYRPLVVDHEIISLPSASTLAVLRQEVKNRKPAAKTVVVLADPVFESDDERVRQATGRTVRTSSDSRPRAENRGLGLELAASESGLKGVELKIPRLPGTREEARQILSLVPPSQSKGSFDFAASRQTATSSELSEYRYVHFATHGFLDSVHPELSGIVLSTIDEKGNPQDGFLRAHEVFNLKLPAELVVLSACETGLGKEVKGEGLVSLTRGFMYAGAPRVVVSLWSVNDQATAELMARFYSGMLRDKLRPAAALRAAQISLMKEKGWQSPFYWAAFTLQGEWR